MRYDLPTFDDDEPVASVPTGVAGTPRLLLIADIDEDPEQPRKEFDDKALRELADTIASRGIRQPISVRQHPTIPSRWQLNFGARRLRASRLAGKTEIPVFIDEFADSYDQVIENEQRENLSQLELALFVQRRLKAGDTRLEIAERLGKSKTYLTMISALIDAPACIMSLYRDGRCRGLTEIYELRRLHEEAPERVEAWLQGREEVTRRELRELKEAQSAAPHDAGAARFSTQNQMPSVREAESPPQTSVTPVATAPMCAAAGVSRFSTLNPMSPKQDDESPTQTTPTPPNATDAAPGIDEAGRFSVLNRTTADGLSSMLKEASSVLLKMESLLSAIKSRCAGNESAALEALRDKLRELADS